MRVLVIDDEARQKATAIVTYARKHLYYPKQKDPPPGNNPNHVCYINTYRCVFSFTSYEGSLFKHLTISVPSENYPSPEAVCEIAGLFEFSGADQGIIERMKSGAWLVRTNKEEHCVVIAEEVK